MIVKDKDGREITILVRGDLNEPEIVEAQYVDSDDDVPEETITYIYSKYADELHQEVNEQLYAKAERWADMHKDGTYEYE